VTPSYRVNLLVCFSVAAVLSVSAATAQTLKGTILGTITDTSHAVVPAVVVNITETNTNFHRSDTTNDSGFFAFANLDPGTYRLDVLHPGFQKIVRPGIILDANSTIRVELELSPGDVNNVVEVSSEDRYCRLIARTLAPRLDPPS
jgi:hypothetical protein